MEREREVVERRGKKGGGEIGKIEESITLTLKVIKT
jgi:hypothetical protein